MHPHLSLTVLAAASAAAASSSHPHRRSTTNPSDLSGKTFDFIIVGGGTAGLALAGRLAEWSNITVAVIEAGSDGTEFADQIAVPGMSYLNGLTGTTFDWQYKTTAQANAGGNPLSWPRGKGLGGSSAINGGFWCRGSSAEYDAWNSLQNGASGAEDWGWDTMQSAIKNAETFTPMSDENAATFSVMHDSNAHGTNGPIHASYSSYQFSHLSTWIPTMVAMGLPHLTDPANGTNHGVSFVPSIINPANGSRSDSNFGYIIPYKRSNLVVLTGYQVTKINWNSTTSGSAVAGGVSFAASAAGTEYSVKAAKEVIISGGTIGSPQILQLSGVGPASLLKGFGIDTVVDLPGVGANVQDHLSASLYMQATDDNTWAQLKDTNVWAEQLAIWKENGTGMWTYWNEATAYPTIADLMGADASPWASGIDTTSALSTSADASTMDSTVQAGVKAQYAILKDWAASSNIGQVELIFNMLGSAVSMIGIQFCIQHAFSRGYIHISSASAFDSPEINPNYLSVSYDLDIMRSAFKFVRRIIATAPMSDMIKGETLPGSTVTADADINSYIAKNSGTEYHPTSSNSMLPRDLGGVVDTKLIVYGTTNVRVVDLSIVPIHVAAHTMATAYGIAERAAAMMKVAHAAVIANSTSDSGSGSGSGSTSDGSTSPNSNNNNATNTSNLSTGTKVAIGAGAGALALVLLAGLILFRRRSANNKRKALTRAAVGKEDAWYAEDDPSLVPRAPFMMAGAGARHSAAPSSISMDSFGTHPDNQQQVDYNQQYYDPAHYGQPQQSYSPYAGSAHSDHEYPQAPRSPHYGDVHANLTTADVAALHPELPPSPGAPYTDSPTRGYHQHPNA
ncbi:hypothetical protein C8R43DRAFT_273227 [Mycena crocata]|nr:hypothetical protein C8R43DRAFT_273227 [Mycena crocata]